MTASAAASRSRLFTLGLLLILTVPVLAQGGGERGRQRRGGGFGLMGTITSVSGNTMQLQMMGRRRGGDDGQQEQPRTLKVTLTDSTRVLKPATGKSGDLKAGQYAVAVGRGTTCLGVGYYTAAKGETAEQAAATAQSLGMGLMMSAGGFDRENRPVILAGTIVGTNPLKLRVKGEDGTTKDTTITLNKDTKYATYSVGKRSELAKEDFVRVIPKEQGNGEERPTAVTAVNVIKMPPRENREGGGQGRPNGGNRGQA